MRRPVERGPETRAKPIENMKLPSLIIQVNEIPEAGKVIETDLPTAWLGDTLLPPYEVLEPVSLSIEVRRVEDNVWIEGKVENGWISWACGLALLYTAGVLSRPWMEF